MARFPIIETGVDTLGEPGPIRLTKDGKVGVEAITQVNDILAAIIRKINRGISYGTGDNQTRTGNHRGQYARFLTPNMADTEFEIPHGLDRIPIGIKTVMLNKAAVLYADRYGSWNTQRILLKCNVASVDCLIEIY